MAISRTLSLKILNFAWLLAIIIENSLQKSLLPSSLLQSGGEFGYSVSFYGNFLIIGSPGYQSNQGCCYIDFNSGNSFQTISASDGISGDKFGSSVSMFGNYVAVGANSKNSSQGSLYVFHYLNSWTQQQKFVPSDAVSGDNFGFSVSIYGNYIVAGSPNSISNQGSAYVFHYQSNSWTQQQKLVPSNGVSGDNFGSSVSIYGNYIVVGSPNSRAKQGSVYVFFNNGKWNQIQELTANNSASGDLFGTSLSIYGNYFVVGAVGSNSNAGSVYVFFYKNSWSQQAELIASGSSSFGNSLSMYGNYVLIGDMAQSIVYVFYYNGTTWLQQQTLSSGNSGNYGCSVSLYENFVLIGAYTEVTGNFLSSATTGDAYLTIITEFSYTTEAPTGPSMSSSQLTSSSTQPTSSINSNLLAIILGSVIGGVLVLTVIIIIILGIWFKRKKPTSTKNNSFHTPANTQTSFVLSEDDILVLDVIGKGSFGEVYKAKFGPFFVACKKIKSNGNADVAGIIKEVEILTKLKHKNVVSLIGIKDIGGEKYMLMEYMNKGDLLSYIRTNEKSLTQANLFDMAEQISCGMSYLEEKHVIHRDLALRNVLCAFDGGFLVYKISDFGLSKITDNYYYVKSDKLPVPIKWSAPEVLFKDKFSSKSDVFSFGVVLFEIFSKGENPWPGKTNEEVVMLLQSGNRMELPPDFAPPFIVSLINECWKENPHERPTFKEIYSQKLQINAKSSNSNEPLRAEPIYEFTP